MKKMKKCNKGFTLTELAIVIAVIAILIAVLVPTFISLINKANESSDKQLVKNLNTSLSTYETINGETDGVLEAVAALKEEGYDVTKLTPTSDGAVIVYNTTTHAFVLYTNDFESLSYGTVNDGDKLVVIGCSTATATAASTLGITEYCVYSEDGATVECTAEGVTIYVYTESGTTIVNAPSADVYHYGEAGTIEITEVANCSYHLYAQTESLKIAKGHVVVEDDVSITKLVVNTTTEGAVTVTKSDSATISRVFTADKTFTVKDEADKTVESISTVIVASLDEIEAMDTVNYISSVPSTITSGTYVLSSNITGNFVIPEKAVVTIDLNGWTITGGAGTATVLNGGVQSTSNSAILNYGTLTITGSGNVNCYGSGIDAAVFNAYGATAYIDGGTYTQGNWYVLNNYGYMQIDNAVVVGTSTETSVVHNGYFSYSKDGSSNGEAVMVINGIYFGNDYTGTVEDTASLIKNDDMGNLTINSGTFKNAPAWVILNWHICVINDGEFSGVTCIGDYSNSTDTDKGELTINGGTFECTTTLLYALGGATITVNDGTFESTESGYYSTCVYSSTLLINGGSFVSAGAFIYASSATVTITDGTFESVQTLIYAGASSSVNISSGTFTHPSSTYYTLYFGGENSSIVITGGTITYNEYLTGRSSSVSSYTYENSATLINTAE